MRPQPTARAPYIHTSGSESDSIATLNHRTLSSIPTSTDFTESPPEPMKPRHKKRSNIKIRLGSHFTPSSPHTLNLTKRGSPEQGNSKTLERGFYFLPPSPQNDNTTVNIDMKDHYV